MAFVDAMGNDKRYRDQIDDARFRLRRLRIVTRTADDGPPGWAPGLAVALIGGGVAGAGGAVHGGTYEAARPPEDGRFDGDVEAFDGLVDANRLGFGLLVGGAATAAVGAVVAAVGGRQRATPVIVALPTPEGGLTVTIGGRW